MNIKSRAAISDLLKAVIYLFQPDNLRKQLIKKAMALPGERDVADVSIRDIIIAGIATGEVKGNVNIDHAEIFWDALMNQYADPVWSEVSSALHDTVIRQGIEIYLQGIAKRTFN